MVNLTNNSYHEPAYVNPIALDRIQWKYYIVYCVWILVEIATVYFFFPETHNRTLEELSFMFEGKEMQDKVAHNVDKQLEAVNVGGHPATVGGAVGATTAFELEEQKRSPV